MSLTFVCLVLSIKLCKFSFITDAKIIYRPKPTNAKLISVIPTSLNISVHLITPFPKLESASNTRSKVELKHRLGSY